MGRTRIGVDGARINNALKGESCKSIIIERPMDLQIFSVILVGSVDRRIFLNSALFLKTNCEIFLTS